MYHQNCNTLKYNKFLLMMIDGDVRHLIIKGNPTNESLLIAWKGILQEYSTLIKTEKTNSIIDLYNKIVFTECKIKLIAVITAQLKSGYDSQLADIIVSLGYPLIVDKEDREEYLKQIYSIILEANNLIVLLNQYAAEYKMLCPDEPNPVKRSMMDYEKELRILSRWYGQRIDPAKESVFGVCAIINAYIEYNKVNAPKV